MNKLVSRVAKTVRNLLEDDELVLSDRDREQLEDCYLTLERIAIKRPLTTSVTAIKTVVNTPPTESANPTGTPF